MPGIVPRAKELAGSGFGYLAFLFAVIYQAVRLIPEGHPFGKFENVGNFTILQVIREASSNLKMDRKHIDQVIVFGALLVGIVLMFLQFIILILTLFTGKAFASNGETSFTSMFTTQHPETDIAFLMLDYVFGIPGPADAQGSSFFGSNALVATGGPTPFQEGMHALFNFYNLSMLLIAGVIFAYYVVVVVVETAQTGVPFGRRFSKIYAPIRLVVAIGLLIPLNYGFNGAQYITLYAAKLGSSFATNGWILYNRAQQNPMGVPNSSLIALPRTPNFDGLLHFSSVYHACREMYAIRKNKIVGRPSEGNVCISSYVIVNGKAQEFVENGNDVCTGGLGNEIVDGIKQIGSGNAGGLTGDPYPYSQAKKDFGNRDIEVVLGEYNENYQEPGNVKPLCGKITISLSNDNPAIYKNDSGSSSSPVGIQAVENMYYRLVQSLLRPGSPWRWLSNETGAERSAARKFNAFGERAAHYYMPVTGNAGADEAERTRINKEKSCYNSNILDDASTCAADWKPPSATFQEAVSSYRTSLEMEVRKIYQDFRSHLNLKLNEELEHRGWGGAGIWFNNIADLNGTFTSAIYAVPTATDFPMLMEEIRKKTAASDGEKNQCEMFSVNVAGITELKLDEVMDASLLGGMNSAYRYFFCDNPTKETGDSEAGSAAAGGGSGSAIATDPCAQEAASGYTPLQTGADVKGVTGNMIVDVMSLIFGINGLFDIRAASQICSETGLPSVNPLAQLTTVGKSLVENAIRMVGVAFISSVGGGFFSVAQKDIGSMLSTVTGMAVSIATIGLTAGFILYYILPFLPFIYFFFAVGAWVKSIFEAMVGVPLWALAHLKIDGDGLPGRAAMGGYFLIFEIFLRPIMTLFGLIGGMVCFTAMAATLNLIFDLVVVNITGALPTENGETVDIGGMESFRRGVIDQFFFTLMYALLLYMMATASFKLIDLIPQAFTRWMKTDVGVFNDGKSDPTDGLTQYAALGGATAGGQIIGGLTQAGSALGATGGAIMGSETKNKSNNDNKKQ